MEKVASFEKISEERFREDFSKESCFSGVKYEELILPKRATVGSAGYDFFSPIDFELASGESIKIPTGVRVKIDDGWVLQLFPRSSLGFKYRLQLDNTVGIIDSDYYYSGNEGHIFIKITNCSNDNKTVSVKKADAFAQGVFLQYGITYDDDVHELRNGGFGSTNKS